MENKKITITLPVVSFSELTADLLNSYLSVKQKFKNIFILFYETGADISYRSQRGALHTMKKVGGSFDFNKKKMRKVFMAIIPLLILVALITAGSQALRSDSADAGSSVLSSNNSTNEPLATQSLNENFDFPLIGDNGKESGEFAYTVLSAELRDQIIIKGQRGTAAPGRVFLIVNLQLKNSLKQGLQINSRDYMRLSINGDRENLLAPEIHNDPVEVQAISTKFTRVGFPINESDNDLVLIVGEIDGDKQEIQLDF